MFPVPLPAGVGFWFLRHGGRGSGGGRAAAEAQGEPLPLPEAHAAVDREGAAPPAGGMEEEGGGRDRGAEGRVGVGDRGVGVGGASGLRRLTASRWRLLSPGQGFLSALDLMGCPFFLSCSTTSPSRTAQWFRCPRWPTRRPTVRISSTTTPRPFLNYLWLRL